MRLLRVTSGAGPQLLEIRSFTKPKFVRYAEVMLQREADTLRLARALRLRGCRAWRRAACYSSSCI